MGEPTCDAAMAKETATAIDLKPVLRLIRRRPVWTVNHH